MAEQFDPYFKWLGIPTEEQPANYYRLLGVPRFVDDTDVIANAADRQMMLVRSFQAGEYAKLSQKLLNEIAEAKVCLLNGSNKEAYDASLRTTTAVEEEIPVTPERPGLGSWAAKRIRRATPLSGSKVHSPAHPSGFLRNDSPAASRQRKPGAEGLNSFEFEEPAADVDSPVIPARPGDANAVSPSAKRAATVRRPAPQGRNTKRISPTWYVAAAGLVLVIVVVCMIASPDRQVADPGGTQGVVNARHEEPVPPPDRGPVGVVQAVHQPPVISPLPDQSLPPGALVRCKIDVRNAPGVTSAIQLHLLDSPLGAELDPISGQFHWQSKPDHANQTYAVQVQARNAEQDASTATFQIHVGDAKAPVDLLALFDPALDSVAGSWRRDGRRLVSPEDPFARIADPFAPPAEYRLHLVITRDAGIGAAVLGIVADGKRVEVVLDGRSDNGQEAVSGLEMIDGKNFAHNETTIHGQRLLADGERTRIDVTVLHRTLTIERNGSKVMQWRADYRRCTPSHWSKDIPDATLYLGTDKSRFTIDEMVLETVVSDREAIKSEGEVNESDGEVAAEKVAEPKPKNEDAAPPGEVKPMITNSIGMRLTLIPAGEFMMGSPKKQTGGKLREPRHRVQITRPFYLGEYEVTQRRYAQVMGRNPSYFSKSGPGRTEVLHLDTSRLPVEMVSWNDAQEFCARLSKMENKTYRLPTEAEWEYACRAHTPTAYSYGDALSIQKMNCGGTNQRTARVGTYPPNPFGLHDMHGNVWEWCSDRFDKDYYEHSPVNDPRGPEVGTQRVLRGGGWNNGPFGCRSAKRSNGDSELHRADVGFRVVREP